MTKILTVADVFPKVGDRLQYRRKDGTLVEEEGVCEVVEVGKFWAKLRALNGISAPTLYGAHPHWEYVNEV